MPQGPPPQPPRPRHPAALPDKQLLESCVIRRGRVGGPGGQRRNKVETAVVITHTPSGVSAQAGERRSPADNTRVAVRRLRLALATEVRTPVPDGDARSELWISRTRPGERGGRIVVNERHRDYPTLLAEAMDVLWACRMDVRRAAARLCVSPTQLVRLIARHAPALAAMNAARSARRLRPLQG